MNRKSGITITMLLSLGILLASTQVAEAKRMGGGSSFGSRPSYSAPYQRSVTPSGPMQQNTQSAQAARQQQASAQNQAARQSWANRGGLMGMRGGLALGGLLGSLFFGGAFEGINFMDILLFAGLGYLLLKLLASRAPQQQPAGNPYQRAEYEPQASQYQDTADNSGPAGFETDVLFGKGKPGSSSVNSVPQGFDQTAFLNGAESAFRYLQTAWDRGDLAAIRGLTTDKVFAEIQDQLRSSTGTNKTEILKLHGELLEAREVGNDWEAAVLFDSMMREDDGQIEQVREVWHFIRAKNSNQAKWYLDGIQQLAE